MALAFAALTAAALTSSPAAAGDGHFQAHNVEHANWIATCRIDMMHGNYANVAYSKVKRMASDCGWTGTETWSYNGSNWHYAINEDKSGGPDSLGSWRQASSAQWYSIVSSQQSVWFGDSKFYFEHAAI